MKKGKGQETMEYGARFIRENLAGKTLAEMKSPKRNPDDNNVGFFHWPEKPFYFTDSTRLYVMQGVPTAIGGNDVYELEAVVLNRPFDPKTYSEATFRCFENPEQHGTHVYLNRKAFLSIRDYILKRGSIPADFDRGAL